MSKNFEEEYKALSENDLPDLWARIDAGLTSKTAGTERVEKTPTEKKGVVIFFKKYKTVVAAAVCAIVIIPTFMLLGDVGSKNYTDASMEESTTTEMAAADEVMEDGESLLSQLHEYAEDKGFAAGSAASDTAEACEEAPASAEMYMDEAADCAADDNIEESVIEELEKKEVSQSKNSGEENCQDSQTTTIVVYDRVSIEVLENTGSYVECNQSMYYEIRIKVLKDSSEKLMKGTELSIYVPITSSIAYITGAKEEVDISYEKGSVCEYQIVRCHKINP